MRNKPQGSRGSWFAEWERESIPVLWEHQFSYRDGEPRIRTDWVGRERHNTGNKREQVRAFYREHLNTGRPTKAVLASQKESNRDQENVPEKKEYIGVFGVLVEAVDPEISLKLVERLWAA